MIVTTICLKIFGCSLYCRWAIPSQHQQWKKQEQFTLAVRKQFCHFWKKFTECLLTKKPSPCASKHLHNTINPHIAALAEGAGWWAVHNEQWQQQYCKLPFYYSSKVPVCGYVFCRHNLRSMIKATKYYWPNRSNFSKNNNLLFCTERLSWHWKINDIA